MKPTTSKRKYTLNQLPAWEEKIYMKRKYTNYQQEKIYMKPTTSKRKYTWNQLPARENSKRKYTWNQLPAR